jgi:hypothetical protein
VRGQRRRGHRDHEHDQRHRRCDVEREQFVGRHLEHDDREQLDHHRIEQRDRLFKLGLGNLLLRVQHVR